MTRTKYVIIILLLSLLSLGIIYMYTTYAYEENTIIYPNSDDDYTLNYSLSNKNELVVNVGETRYVDIVLSNTYEYPVKYGVYYYLVSPSILPSGVNINLASTSTGKLSANLKKGETTTVTLEITNDSTYVVKLITGTLIGFENSNLEDLATDNLVLIK